MSKLNLNIASAHVATFGERAVDVFYVTDLMGAKISSPTRNAAVKRALIGLFALPQRSGGATRRRRVNAPERGRSRFYLAAGAARHWVSDASLVRIIFHPSASRRAIACPLSAVIPHATL